MVFPKIHSINQKIELDLLIEKGVSLYLKREDQSHPLYGGNKVRKLKYHVLETIKNKDAHFLTFGGAWSNHIYASAAFFNEIGRPIIGVIRGEEPKKYSDTLLFAQKMGMHLHFISRSEYRRKYDDDFLEELQSKFNNPVIIPEGGSGELGVRGCTEILTTEDSQFDYIASGVGTGGTIAGVTLSLLPHQHSIAFSALKGGGFLKDDIGKLMNHYSDEYPVDDLKKQLILQTDYHFGGFAKSTPELIKFMKEFYLQTNIKLDHIYTAKMLFGLMDMIKNNYFAEGSKILAIHTGGQQGLKGLELRIGERVF